jgi:hypothetical protein
MAYTIQPRSDEAVPVLAILDDTHWIVAGEETDDPELILGALFGCGCLAWPRREIARC